MPDQADHDLLIEIKTTVRMLADGQSSFMKELRDLNLRVTNLEIKDKGDSATFKTVAKDVQDSLSNSRRISDAFIELEHLKEDIGELKKKSNLFDAINGIGVVVTGIIGYVFGNR